MDNYTLLLPWTAAASVITVRILPLPPRNQEAPPPPHPPNPQLQLSVTADPNTCAPPSSPPNPVVIKHIFKGLESSQKCSLPNFGGSRSSLSCLLFLWYDIKQLYKQGPPPVHPHPQTCLQIFIEDSSVRPAVLLIAGSLYFWLEASFRLSWPVCPCWRLRGSGTLLWTLKIFLFLMFFRYVCGFVAVWCAQGPFDTAQALFGAGLTERSGPSDRVCRGGRVGIVTLVWNNKLQFDLVSRRVSSDGNVPRVWL